MVDRIAIALESVKPKDSSTRPLLAIGDGRFSEHLIEMLARHFLVVRVPEPGTSQACAHCRQRLEFASKRQLRTKACPNPRCVRYAKFADRDRSASMNILSMFLAFVLHGRPPTSLLLA